MYEMLNIYANFVWLGGEAIDNRKKVPYTFVHRIRNSLCKSSPCRTPRLLQLFVALGNLMSLEAEGLLFRPPQTQRPSPPVVAQGC